MIGPYFFRFFKWECRCGIVRLAGAGRYAAARLELSAAGRDLIQAFVGKCSADSGPLAVSRARRALPTAPVALYFLAIGLAFMFMEIAFIQKFVLFLAHPLYAVAVVLCAFLVFAAAGSWLAGQWQRAETATAI